MLYRRYVGVKLQTLIQELTFQCFGWPRVRTPSATRGVPVAVQYPNTTKQYLQVLSTV